MRARSPNTSPRAVVAPANPRGPFAFGRGARVLCGAPALRRARTRLAAIVLAGGLAGCGGGGSPSAQSLLDKTFNSHKPIQSGRLDLSLALSPVAPVGSPAPRSPFSVRLTGPFQSLGAGRLPRFALQLSLTDTRGRSLQAGAISTGERLYAELAGITFLTPQSTAQALQRGYAEASRAASSTNAGSTFAALGIDPGRWLIHPVLAGSSAGAGTVHIVAGLNVPRFFADVEKLSGAGRALGGGGPELLSPAQISVLANSLRAARVDVYSGAVEHLLRRLSLKAVVVTTARARATLGGLRRATLTVVLQFADLNLPVTIVPPSNPQPASRLVLALERLGLIPRLPPRG